MKLTLDANVLYYAQDADSGRKAEIANRLIRRAALSDCCLTVQAVGETYFALTRKGRMPSDAAGNYVNRLTDAFPMIGNEGADLRNATEAVTRHQLSFWDAMLWATADRAGCEIVVSEDFQHGRTLGRVTFLDPFQAPFPEDLEAALTPL